MARRSYTLLPATLAAAIGAAGVATAQPVVFVDSGALTSSAAIVREVLSETPHDGGGVVSGAGEYGYDKDYAKCHDKTTVGPITYSKEGYCKKGDGEVDGGSLSDSEGNEVAALVAKLSS